MLKVTQISCSINFSVSGLYKRERGRQAKNKEEKPRVYCRGNSSWNRIQKRSKNGHWCVIFVLAWYFVAYLETKDVISRYIFFPLSERDKRRTILALSFFQWSLKYCGKIIDKSCSSQFMQIFFWCRDALRLRYQWQKVYIYSLCSSTRF